MVRLLVPEGLGYPSGGTLYNERLALALTALGVPVEVVGVSGEWPVGSAQDRACLAEAVARAAGPADDGAFPAVLVDGLLALGAPEAIGGPGGGPSAHAVGILVHMPLSDAPGLDPRGRERLAALEREALCAAGTVIVPSRFAAARLARRYGTAARVAVPGVVRGSGSHGSPGAPRLLCLAALLPGKGQLRLLRALGALRGLSWTAMLAGHDGADPAFAAALRREAARLGISDRVVMPGHLGADALDAEWARTDLSVLASESETFGMAVAESLAHAVPAVVAAGTGAAEALGLSLAGGLGPAGAVVAGGSDAYGDPLTLELARWFADSAVRARWKAAAQAARPLLPAWDATARDVLRALGVSPASAGS